MARGAARAGWSALQIPLADGGEGLLDALGALGGVRQSVEVEGPLGTPVVAQWLRIGDVAVIEMAQASGLALAGGAEANDPLRASTRGTGQLIAAAARSLAPGTSVGPDGQAGRGTVVVGLGGSATTDGGRGAVAAIEEEGGLGTVQLLGACDVDVDFRQAAARFGPQKGADPTQVVELEHRLDEVAHWYEQHYGVDVRAVAGTGAAGGLGGGIVALGGSLRSGYAVVTELVGFTDALRRCSLVVTGEGAFDATSLLGKVVGSVMQEAASCGVPAAVVAGQVTDEAASAAEAAGVPVVSLTTRFGRDRAVGDTARCIEEAVGDLLGPGALG
jgi:glycerate kinase